MRARIVKGHLRRAALVTTKTGDAYRGVLFDADSAVLILRNASALDPRQQTDPVNVDGELLVTWADVAYVQFV